MEDIINKICECMEGYEYPITALFIAKKLDTTKKEINGILYKEKDKFEQLECSPPLWRQKK